MFLEKIILILLIIPTIIFYNKDGIKKNGYEVVGYMKAKEFAQHTQSALNTNPIIMIRTIF